MKNRLKYLVLLTTLALLLGATTMTVFAAPLQGTWMACPYGGAPCTGCISGGSEPNNYFCNSSGWMVI